MDIEILYATVGKRFGVKRFIAKKAVDWWLKNRAEPGMFLKGAFDSPDFRARIEAAIARGHPNAQQRKSKRKAKEESSGTC